MCMLSVCPENTEYSLNINDVLTTGFLYLVAEIPVLFLEVMRHSEYTAKHR